MVVVDDDCVGEAFPAAVISMMVSAGGDTTVTCGGGTAGTPEARETPPTVTTVCWGFTIATEGPFGSVGKTVLLEEVSGRGRLCSIGASSAAITGWEEGDDEDAVPVASGTAIVWATGFSAVGPRVTAAAAAMSWEAWKASKKEKE